MNHVRLIPIDTHVDNRRGNLSVIEELPFKIKRVFSIYNVPTSEMRGGHAHKKCHQFLIAMCGVVIIKTGDGKEFVLDCPDIGLYVPPMNIINLMFITEETTLLVLASEKYNKDDYMYGSDPND